MLATRQAHRLLLLPPGVIQLVTEHVTAHPLRTPRLLAVPPQRRPINNIPYRVNNLSWGGGHDKLRSLSIHALRAATEIRELRDFYQRYKSLHQEYQRLVINKKPPPASDIGWVVSMCLKSLSAHEDLVAAKAALQIYSDLRAGKWSQPPELRDFASLITVLCAVNAMKDAEHYLKECLQRVPQNALDATVYSDIIRRYARRSNFDQVWLWYQDAKSRGVEVTPTIYLNVVDALLAQSDSIINSHILEIEVDISKSEEMGTLGLLIVLLSVLDRLGQSRDAATAKNKLLSLLSADGAFQRDDPLFIRAWTTIFTHIINRGEISMVKHLASLAKSKGYSPGDQAFTYILNRSDVNTVKDLQTLEDAFSLAAPAEAWATVIRKILDREGVAAALDVYDASKAAGVRPLPASVNPLIHKMLIGRPNYLRIAWSDIQRAFSMYNDLVQAWNQSVAAPSRKVKNRGQGQPWTMRNMVSVLTGNAERPEPESSIRSIETKWTKSPERGFGGPDQATLDALLNALSRYASQSDSFPQDDTVGLQAEPIERAEAEPKDEKQGKMEELPLSDGRPTRKDVWKIASRLLEDMRAFRIESDARFRSSFIVLMIRLAPTFQAAFHVYRALVRGDQLADSEAFEGFTTDFATLNNLQLKRFELNGVEWQRIIINLCHVREKYGGPGMSFPPAEMFVEMVRDMQVAGWPATERMYMLYVGRLLRQARQLKVWQRGPYLTEEKEPLEGLDEDEDAIWQGVTPSTFLDVRNSILHSIRHLHHHISVSAGITPSTKLLNAVLEAYNRVAAMHDAFKLWDYIWLSQIHDNWTVSVILDTCGWGKAGHRAAQIWNNLVAIDFPLNKYNWDARVECLCRLGRLSDAVKVVCLEMPQQHLDNMARYEEYRRKLIVQAEGEVQSPVRRQVEEQKAAVNEWGVMPDVATLNVLLSFAVQTNEVRQVKEKIRRYLPTLWNSLAETDRRMWS